MNCSSDVDVVCFFVLLLCSCLLFGIVSVLFSSCYCFGCVVVLLLCICLFCVIV